MAATGEPASSLTRGIADAEATVPPASGEAVGGDAVTPGLAVGEAGVVLAAVDRGCLVVAVVLVLALARVLVPELAVVLDGAGLVVARFVVVVVDGLVVAFVVVVVLDAGVTGGLADGVVEPLPYAQPSATFLLGE